MLMRGMIFNIQRFSLHDGPGIRTNIFFQGCPLSCEWCHNPEGKRFAPVLRYDSSKCVGCGECVKICDCHRFEGGIHTICRENCNSCGKCADVCMWEALELPAHSVTADEVMEQIVSDIDFFRESGGGITLTGGEPLAQPEFALALAKKARERGISVCLETSGFCSPEILSEIAPFISRFLYDWKITDDELHRRYTGQSNQLIRENLRLLNRLGAELELRCPIIPTINDSEAHLSGIAALAKELSAIRAITLEGYHVFGRDKAEQVGEKPFFLSSSMNGENLAVFAEKLKSLLPKEVELNIPTVGM